MRHCTPAALAFAIVFSLPACESSTPITPSAVTPIVLPTTAATAGTAHSGHNGSTGAKATALGADVNRQIEELRALMAPFHNFSNAVAFGYSVPAPGPGVCISDPVRGGMGYHYTLSQKDLISDGTVNLLEPEFIVYSPQANGQVRLSAADYFVPYNTWQHAEPPSLLGIPFAREDAFQAYVLHIWAFWHNPAGMFENYNPDVPLCPE